MFFRENDTIWISLEQLCHALAFVLIHAIRRITSTITIYKGSDRGQVGKMLDSQLYDREFDTHIGHGSILKLTISFTRICLSLQVPTYL